MAFAEHIARQVVDGHHTFCLDSADVFDDVFQFADIALPRICSHEFCSFRVDSLDEIVKPRVLYPYIINAYKRNIACSLAQWHY